MTSVVLAVLADDEPIILESDVSSPRELLAGRRQRTRRKRKRNPFWSGADLSDPAERR